MFKKKDKDKGKKDNNDSKSSDYTHTLPTEENLQLAPPANLTSHSQLNTPPNPMVSQNDLEPNKSDSMKISEDNIGSSNNKTLNTHPKQAISESNVKPSLSGTETQKESENKTRSDTETEINQLLFSIVSGFSEYFYTVATTIFGNRPKKIVFDSIRSDRKIGTTGIELVTVNFSCELGHARAGLAVKIHHNASEVLQIVENINYLVQHLEPYRFLGVSTPKIVFQKGQILVLEGISGESFRHSPVPITEKFRLAGKCLAALCGPQPHKVNSNRYRILEKQVLDALPIDENFKQIVAKKLSFFPLEKLSHECGAISFGDFHSGNLLYEINLYTSPILVAHLIDPEFLQKDAEVDRFEDIANFFVNSAIKEFELKNNLFQITRDIRSFLAGYNEVLAYSLLSIESFYPEGTTFNYHLALGILLSILNLLNIGMEPTYVDAQAKLRLKLVNVLLDSPPILSDSLELSSGINVSTK